MEKRPRKSTLGTHGVPPIRMKLSPPRRSPLGSGISPRPTRFCTTRPSPRLGSAKTRKLSPMRLGDISSKDLSYFLSSKKKPKLKTPTVSVPSKSRRCLYKDGVSSSNCQATAEQIPGQSKSFGSLEASKMNLGRPARKSKIPMPGSLCQNQNVATLNKAVPMPCVPPSRKVTKTFTVTSKQIIPSVTQTESLNQILQQMNAVAADQKAMLTEAKELFGGVLQEQRNILHEMRLIQDAHQKLFQSQEFISFERNIENDCESKATSSEPHSTKEVENFEAVLNASDKENSTRHPSRKSVVAYKEMRKSFRCLNTPTLSSKKSRTPRMKTPRSALSAKVKAQLESLLDE